MMTLLASTLVAFLCINPLLGNPLESDTSRHIVGTHQVIVSPKDAQSIRYALSNSQIIDDVLDDFLPSVTVDALWPGSGETAQLGNDIPQKSVEERPIIRITPLMHDAASSSTNETLNVIMTDPDAKSRDKPKWSEMCHWILTNVHLKGNTTKESIEYLPPSPPPKTGKHRYVLVALKGNATRIPAERKHWGYGKVRHGVRDWAKENDLEVLGANFFYVANKKQ